MKSPLLRANAAAFFAAVFLLAGCLSDANHPVYIATSQYDCAGQRLAVRWNEDFADVSFGNNAGNNDFRLPRARSGSGARYADGTREIWEHQGELRWTDAGAAPVICRLRTHR